MIGRLLLVALLSLGVEFVAFRYVHRDLLRLDAVAAAPSPVAGLRQTTATTLARPHLSRHHAEALVTVTDRDGLRDLHMAALARLAKDYPDDASVLLRYAEALATQRRFDEAARVYARVAEAR